MRVNFFLTFASDCRERVQRKPMTVKAVMVARACANERERGN